MSGLQEKFKFNRQRPISIIENGAAGNYAFDSNR